MSVSEVKLEQATFIYLFIYLILFTSFLFIFSFFLLETEIHSCPFSLTDPTWTEEYEWCEVEVDCPSHLDTKNKKSKERGAIFLRMIAEKLAFLLNRIQFYI